MHASKKKVTGSYKPGNVRKGSKAGPGRRAGTQRKKAGTGGSESRLSGSRAQYVRRRRNT